jgi:aspartyl-tRNA(Asn)/glutamyl-tRNA(Gln) amidotransferase subunit A
LDQLKEFLAMEITDDYRRKLVEELKDANSKLKAFTFINETIGKGFPFSVKDNICVKNVETTAGSEILRGYFPPFNATSVSRMNGAGYAFLGKTAMDEFGFGSFGINTYQIARNPFDTDRVAGGSSSGAAVATSILKYHVALCESTGGSIANPASLCGVVGFTPTYGAVSRYGLVDYSNSLDKIGVMGRKAETVKSAFDAIRGGDPMDSTSSDRAIDSERRKKLYVISNMLEEVDHRIKGSFEALLNKLGSEGYEISEVEVKSIEKSIPAYYIISMAEASTNLARYTGYKYGKKVEDFTKHYNDFFTEARESFGIEAKRRIIAGTLVRSASVRGKYYTMALKVRRLIINRLNELLKDGFVINPTIPFIAPKISDAAKMGPVATYAGDFLNIPPNLAGLPHISFPFDYIDGMPIGAQLTTSHFNDHAILDFVAEWEKGFEYRFKYNIGSV